MKKIFPVHHKIIYFSLSVLWIFFQITGFLYAQNETILWTPYRALGICLTSIILGALFGVLLLYLLDKLTVAFPDVSENTKVPAKLMLLLGSVLFLCWLPGFLAYFPGICSYDFSIQMGQIENGLYSDHHPVAHTLLLELFWKAGTSIFQSGTMGIAFYTLFQMIFLILVIIYGCYLLLKTGKSRKLITILVILLALFPPNIFMSISATKDTIFSAFVLLFLLSGISLSHFAEPVKNKRGSVAILFLSTVGIVFFRNNGKYALLALLVATVLLFVFHKMKRNYYKIIFLTVLCGFFTASVGLTVIQTAIDCAPGDRREMLSIPIQQWARIAAYHRDDLSEETYDFMSQCISEDGLLQYDPYISDPVKRHTDTTFILNHASTFIKTYLQLFLEYPGEYLNAFLIQNSGFLYIGDTSHAWINYNEDIPGYGYIQTHELEDELLARDIHKASRLPWLYAEMEAFANENRYLSIPVLNILMSPAIYFAILIFVLGYAMIKKYFAIFVPMSFLAGYYLTMLLGPTVQLRYIYPVMLSMPFLLLLYFRKR